jgi:UDP-N-acetylmuramate-alanine ligase
LAEYRGVRARQEVIADDARLTVVYDMGIYPKALAKVVRATRESAAGRRLGVLFQPRYTMGREDEYYRGLASAFADADCVLVTDAPVPQEGLDGWFAFDPQNLRVRLSCPVQEVGPALQCYPRWEDTVREGDVWLILTEPMFPEPLGSIREYCRDRGFFPAAAASI